MKSILVIRGGAIGDFVLTLPAIKLLRDAYPEARLEILGYPHIAALAEGRFYADAIRSLESGTLASFFAPETELPHAWVEYFSSFELIVSYLFDPAGIFTANLHRCGIGRLITGSPKTSDTTHAAQQLAQPLGALGLSLPDPAACLFPSSSDRATARALSLPRSLIALHPGSGSQTKNWPIKCWIELLQACQSYRAASEFLIVGGEADAAELTAMRQAFPAANFAENLPLPVLAAVLEGCRAFLGHDSGIAHIAAAVGTRSLLLFGPSAPTIWAPANPEVRTLKAPDGDLTKLPVAAVAAAFSALLRESDSTTS